MVPVVNIIKLESLLSDFFHLTRIRITIFNENFEEIIAYPSTIAPPCKLIRTDKDAEKNCICSDRNACKMAKGKKSTYIYRCHAGFTEAITPIQLSDIIIGYLFFGHIFSYTNRENGYQNIQKLCAKYKINIADLLYACDDQSMLSKEYILSASRIMETISTYLCYKNIVLLRQQELPIQIDAFINTHLAEKLTIKNICDYFQIGKTQLCEIAKCSYGRGLASHIRNLRIKHAKKLLLENPDIQIFEIASLCGFDDYNYFINLFKRLTNMTPKQYQRTANQDYLNIQHK